MWSAPAERSGDGAFLQPRRSCLGQELAILFLIAPFMGGRGLSEAEFENLLKEIN